MSDEGGVVPSDVMRDITLGEVTPRPGKGALGTWRDVGHGPRRRAGKKPKPKDVLCLQAN